MSTRDKFPLASKLWDAHIADCCDRPDLAGQHLDEASSMDRAWTFANKLAPLVRDEQTNLLEW